MDNLWTMASVTTLLNEKYKHKDGKFPIVVRITNGRDQRIIYTGHRVFKEQFDGKVSKKHPDAAIINSKISEITREASHYIADCELHNKPIHLDLIGKENKSHLFTEYLEHRAAQYLANKQIDMNYKLVRLSKDLQAYYGREVYFSDLTGDFVRGYDSYLKKIPNCANTRSKKMSDLGRFFTDAVDDGKASGPNPFKKYKIPAEPVKKEKLLPEEIKAIEDLELKGLIDVARDVFLFSFYCKGSRFETCIKLKRSQIHAGRISIQMNKGKKYISVQIHSRLENLLKKYKGKDLIFPVLKSIPTDAEEYRSAIGSANSLINKYLKKVAKLAGIKKNLSMHIARHSFAFQLKGLSVSIHAIKDALGQSDYKTTERYLQQLDDTALDSEMTRLYGE